MAGDIDWEMVFTKLAAGIWTWEQAAAETNMSVAMVKAQVLAARKLAMQAPRLFELAGRIIARYGLAAAPEGGGIIAAITAWMAGISSTALFVTAGGVIVVGLVGGYVWSRGDAPIRPSARATGEVCPDQTPRPHNCPWSPAGVEVGSCKPGYCYDAGYNHSLACKQEDQAIPNAHATDLNDLVCNDGFPVHVTDPCTGALLRCEAGGG